jgi:hypothetical protein
MDTNNDIFQDRDPADRLDALLRAELRWEAPAALTAQLLALVPGAPVLFAAAPQPKPKRWYVVLVMVLTAAAVLLSLIVAWQFYSLIGAQLGLPEMWRALMDAPSLGLARLLEALPQASYAVSLLSGVRSYLYWLLLVAVLWLALDGSSLSFSLNRQQTT